MNNRKRTDEEWIAKEKSVVSAWNGWELSITEIATTLRIDTRKAREFVQKAFDEKRTERPLKPKSDRISRTGRI